MGHTQQWVTYHSSMPENRNLQLDVPDAFDGEEQYGFIDAPDDTDIILNASSNGTYYGNRVARNYDYICYAWKAVAGVSAFGTHTGQIDTTAYNTGVTNAVVGANGYCGFKPRYVMVKRTTGAADWNIWDSFREDGWDNLLNANESSIENTSPPSNLNVQSLDYGFTTGDHFAVGGSSDYISMAFA